MADKDSSEDEKTFLNSHDIDTDASEESNTLTDSEKREKDVQEKSEEYDTYSHIKDKQTGVEPEYL